MGDRLRNRSDKVGDKLSLYKERFDAGKEKLNQYKANIPNLIFEGMEPDTTYVEDQLKAVEEAHEATHRQLYNARHPIDADGLRASLNPGSEEYQSWRKVVDNYIDALQNLPDETSEFASKAMQATEQALEYRDDSPVNFYTRVQELCAEA